MFRFFIIILASFLASGCLLEPYEVSSQVEDVHVEEEEPSPDMAESMPDLPPSQEPDPTDVEPKESESEVEEDPEVAAYCAWKRREECRRLLDGVRAGYVERDLYLYLCKGENNVRIKCP